MEKKTRRRRFLPAWLLWLATALVIWGIITVAVNALSGDITLDTSVGDISISAGLPKTYSAKVNGEDFVYDEDGNLVYDESEVSEDVASKCIAWNYNSEASTLSGEICALYNEGCLGKDMQSVKATLVFTNTNETDDMILSFDYSYTTAAGGGNLTGLISGANASESGNVTATIAKGESQPIVLYSGSLSGVDSEQEEFGKVTLSLTNITVTNANQTQSATLVPANNGMYQASFVNSDGDKVSYVVTTAAITPELRDAYPNATVVNANQTVEYRLSGGLTLTSFSANPNFRFDHWQAGDINLGDESSAKVIPAAGANVTAVYLQESYINAFKVGNQIYYSWNEAVNDAINSHNPIILNQDYTFPATRAAATAAGETDGSYVVDNGSGLTYVLPAGVRFIVPKSEGDFGNFTNVLPAGVTATTPITHFRTLTVPSGVTLQINGEISVNGDYYCKQPYETVAGGAHGLVSLNQGAKISVADGGKIWCYGFIAGAGEVEISAGGHAAELLQICDWGGGSAALGWAMNTDNMYNAFYFSQYYVQNIEAKLTVYEGATTEVAVAIVASGQVASSHAPFIGEGGLFHITEAGGRITRTYDAATDRTKYDVYGDMETSGITVGIMQYKLASDSYVLGINGNLSINVQEGNTTLLNDFMLLPGTEINVAEGASVEVAQTSELSHIDMETGETVTEERPVRLFIIDDYEWNNTIDTTADPLTQLQQLNNGNANYSYPRKQNTLPYTIANGNDNGDVRGNVTAESATINVDGEATFYSNVFTTNYVGWLYDTMRDMLDDPDTRAEMEAQYGAATVAWAEGLINATYDSSKDKLITGSGTIINNEAADCLESSDSKLNLLTQSGTTKNQVNIPTSGVLVDLNGDGTYSELGTGTYESAGVDPETGATVWYKNQITYHFVTIDPATQQPTGTLPEITRKVGVDYDVLTAEDLTVGGQRYAIFGFDASTVQTGAMGGIPIGFVAEDGEVIKDGNFNLSGDSQNRNFATPASWNELMSDTEGLMTYVMSNGITSGWDTMGFVFADLSKMSGTMSDMLCGGLSGEITVYVVAYDHYVAWENATTGERAQSYLPSGVTAAQYEMDGEATLDVTYTDPSTGSAITVVNDNQSKADNKTTLSLADVDRDILASITATYTKVQLTWKFVDADDDSNVYATETTDYDISLGDPAVSPAFTNEAHPYYLVHGDMHTKVADRYPSVASVVTLSSGETANGTASLTEVSLTGITEPMTVFVKVDAYDYKLSFTTDEATATVEDFYVKDGDDLTLTVSDIVLSGEDKFCYDGASVTGTAIANVTNGGAELAITEIDTDATVALDLRGYDYLISYYLPGSVVYDFVVAGDDSSYTYEEGYYDTNYTTQLNNNSLSVNYQPALDGQCAVLTIPNVSRDNSYTLMPSSYDRALIIYDENDTIKKLYYGNGSDVGDNYRYVVNQYVKSLTNPNGAVVEDHLDQQYADIRTNGTGFFPVTVQIGTYYHVVEFRYFQPDGSINGTKLVDSNDVALSTRIFVEEEDGTVGISTSDFMAAYTAGAKTVPAYENANGKVFLYMASYSETGEGHANTYSYDGQNVTVSNIGKNAFVNIIVVPYANTVTVTDNGLGVTKTYYADANGKDLTDGYKAAGTADVTYSAGANRAINGVTGIENCTIDATEEQLEAGVDSITVTSITGDASITLSTMSTKHKLTVEYIDPWGTTTETLYPEGDIYSASFFDRTVVRATVTTEDGSYATATSTGFTVTMPDANTVTKVVVEFRYTTERLYIDVANHDQFTNATKGTATINVTDSAYGVFTVTCAKACVIAIDNGDGTYTRMTATPTADANTYEFTCPANFPEDISIVVAVKGDANGDGKINALDATQVKSASIKRLTLTGVKSLVADVNRNGKVDALDATQVKSASIGKLTFGW